MSELDDTPRIPRYVSPETLTGGMVLPSPKEQHIYHHYDREQKPSFNFKVDRNSRGYNWEITIIGATTADEAIALENEAMVAVRALIAKDEDFVG